MEETSGIVVDCSGEMTLARAEEIRESLLGALLANRPVVVTCAATVEADVSFIQLLIAARASAARRGVSFTLAQPVGGPLRAALRRGGFVSEMPLPNDDFWNGGD